MSIRSKMKKGNLLRFVCMFAGHRMEKGTVQINVMGIRATTVGMICRRCKKLEPLSDKPTKQSKGVMDEWRTKRNGTRRMDG